MDALIYPVILAGGSGTRLWPKSREKHPKQFIHLINGRSLFQETCLRFSSEMFGPLTIITHEDHRFLVKDQLKEIGIHDANIISEPVARNTAAACLAGALFLKNEVGDVPILFTPADQSIKNEHELFNAISKAKPYIMKGFIGVFGIQPTFPHTGYGYVKGAGILSEGIIGPSIIIEKPDKEKAEELIKSGALWNSGLYFCTPNTLLTEASLYMGDLKLILEAFFETRKELRYGFYSIDKDIYKDIESISIDKGIAEKTNKLIIAKTPIEWSDLGSWSSLYEHFDKNQDGNVLRGDTLAINTKNSYVESDTRLVTVLGLSDVGVVETPDAVMVFPLKESELVKKVVSTLSEKNRRELHDHITVHRPWGKYTILGDEDNFKSKKITVFPNAQLSLQRHKHRAEHWIVVSGTATVTRDDEVFELQENESTFLPKGSIHKLENKHSEMLVIIEVQTGTYFGEDDIERFEDTYGRV